MLGAIDVAYTLVFGALICTFPQFANVHVLVTFKAGWTMLALVDTLRLGLKGAKAGRNKRVAYR